MSDAKRATDRPQESSTAKQFDEWCDQEVERRRARDVELDEGLFGDARALVQRRLAAKEQGR
ncbi:MAG: hypothetical protein GY898_21290 [Proteobacteria bacterium]|nr:hypothetical protein [Pseudomonadota bacterium]